MRRSTVSLLRCPSGCRGELNLQGEACTEDQIEQGTLLCSDCERRYPIEDGIARMLPGGLTETEATADEETARKRSEMVARDAQVADYDRMLGLALFGKLEIPVTLAMLRPQPDTLLLEAGCGTGRMTSIFASRCRSQVSVDFSWESLRVCKQKLDKAAIHHVDLIQADVCALPFQSGLFGKVVSCQVLEHIPTPDSRARMISELARVAKPGGDVVLSAYQHNAYTRLFGQKEGAHAGGIYYYRFQRRELRDLLARSLEVRGLTGALVYHYLARCRKSNFRQD